MGTGDYFCPGWAGRHKGSRGHVSLKKFKTRFVTRQKFKTGFTDPKPDLLPLRQSKTGFVFGQRRRKETRDVKCQNTRGVNVVGLGLAAGDSLAGEQQNTRSPGLIDQQHGVTIQCN